MSEKVTERDNNIPADWLLLLDEYQRRIVAGRGMGGDEKLARRAARHKPHAREMIERLVDEGSFFEIGTLAGGYSYQGEPTAACDALVGGLATINGRAVVVGVEDFTVMGGSIGHATGAKKLRLARLALQEKVPFISILEGSGERVSNSLTRHPYAPTDMQVLTELSGIVPTVALIVGASAGHGAISGMLKDFIIMTRDACMFAAGPPLVEAALGEKVSKEELGAAAMHTADSGAAHNLVETVEEGFVLIRRYLAFLPSSAYTVSERLQGEMTEARELPDMLSLLPCDDRIAYDMHQLLDLIVDKGHSPLELQADYGCSMVTSLARLGGYAVGIVANQPAVMAGAITAEAAEKAAHFINLCSAYHLPVIFLADNPGVMSGTAAERAGTLRSAARMYAAQAALSSPKLHVTLRKAFGFGSSLMGMNPFDRQTLTLALPGIALGGIPALGGGVASGADEDTAEQLKRAEESAAWSAADAMAYDEVIDPRQLRNTLLRGLSVSEARQKNNPQPVVRTGISP